MSKTAIEVITSVQRRRRWSAEETERLVAAPRRWSLTPATPRRLARLMLCAYRWCPCGRMQTRKSREERHSWLRAAGLR